MSEENGKFMMFFGGSLLLSPLVGVLLGFLIGLLLSIIWTTQLILVTLGGVYILICILFIVIGAFVYSKN